MHERGGGRGLRLSPFRGLRFPLDGPDLAGVLCPPYDVVEPQRRAELVARDPHNVVRLTLPEARDPAAAASTLSGWVSAGVLRTDESAGLYVLEQHRGDRRWRGVVAAVDLDSEVLRHEDVMPHVVHERQTLLAELRTDLEPLLLTVDGGLGTALSDALATALPLASTHLGDTGLRLWQVVDHAAQDALVGAAAQRVGLIADGHHRWSAARRHSVRTREAHGPGPWDRCLALVVDSESDPLELGAIHRVVDDVHLGRVRAEWARAGRWEQVSPEPEALASAVETGAPGTLGVTDGRDAWLVRAGGVAGGRLDVEWLHHELLPLLDVAENAVTYHHGAGDAVMAARALAGTAVVCAPVPVATVRERAAAGRLMPRKATSFGPKPPSGLVMRRHGEG